MRASLALLALAACAAPDPTGAPSDVAANCTYTNPWSKSEECRDYLGEWPEDQSASDCTAAGADARHESGKPCAYPKVLGRCVIESSVGWTRLTFPGEDVSGCEMLKTACEFFASGTFQPDPSCSKQP